MIIVWTGWMSGGKKGRCRESLGSARKQRLQGFPDNYTRYGIYDGERKEIAKIHRYALLGNAVSVPVVREVAARIRQTTTLF